MLTLANLEAKFRDLSGTAYKHYLIRFKDNDCFGGNCVIYRFSLVITIDLE